MATKKIRELTFDDLGERVVYQEADGDRESGVLTSIEFQLNVTTGRASATMSIGNAHLTIKAEDVERVVEVRD